MGCHLERLLKLSEPRSHPGRSIGQQDNGVVRAHVTVHRDAIERVLDRRAQSDAQSGLGDGCVGGDHTKHGRHIRVDHSRALGNTADLKSAGFGFQPEAHFLGKRVAGHNRLGAIRTPTAGQPDARNPFLDALDWKRDADATRRTYEDLLGLEPNARGGHRRHQPRVRQTLRAGARIGISAVENGAANISRPEMLHRHLHRRRFHKIGRERCR